MNEWADLDEAYVGMIGERPPACSTRASGRPEYYPAVTRWGYVAAR